MNYLVKNINLPSDIFIEKIQPIYNLENYVQELRLRLHSACQTAQDW